MAWSDFLANTLDTIYTGADAFSVVKTAVDPPKAAQPTITQPGGLSNVPANSPDNIQMLVIGAIAFVALIVAWKG